MTLPSPFTLPRSRFNEFLFASIGNERNGMPLSVVSALARLEVDPWQEAARLSDLPVERAAAALEGLIRRLPTGGWDPTEIRTIAARLIALLPQRRGAARPRADEETGGQTKARPPLVLGLLVLALAAVLLFSLLAGGGRHADDSGPPTGLTNGARPSVEP